MPKSDSDVRRSVGVREDKPTPDRTNDRAVLTAALVAGLTACGITPPDEQDHETTAGRPRAVSAATLSTYFPPPESGGGWRTAPRAADVRALGIDSAKAAALGAYVMSVPSESYSTGVSGYNATDTATLVIKNGWLVGEFYNQESARTGVYALASNGKTFSIMLVGRMQLDYPALGIGLDSRLYDSRWLSQGFPLSDPRKADITLDHVFRHVSGIVPQVEAQIADGAVPAGADWNFVPFTLGFDADWPVSAKLYYPPGDPSGYTKGRTYSSVAFNHFSLIFRNVTGLEPGAYLRTGVLNPIGVGRMAYKRRSGMGDYQWATAGNGLTSARDFARLAYLLLHEGTWGSRQIFSATWIRKFTSAPGYPNIRSNQDCYWGAAYPKDMCLTAGSGINKMVVVPSLDLVATINGRLRTSMDAEVTRNFLAKLFAAVTGSYVTCDGRLVGTSPSLRMTGLTLINADTDRPIGALTDGMTLDLATLPTRRLNVRADPATASGSVRFGLDLQANYRTESDAPYALAGDRSGDYNPWTPTLGTHTITATPHSGAAATGMAGTPMSVRFTVR
jgi:CubicO group peptidase (beta-lactamase class C family)